MTNDTIAISEEQFGRLIECYRLLVRKLCWERSNGDIGRCTELVQDCYLDLWRHLTELQSDIGTRRARSWVAWRCRNVLSHRCRKKRHTWVPLDEVPDALLPVHDPGPTLREQVEALATGLTPRERRYLDMHLDGYSNAEIATALQLLPDSLRHMRQRVIEKMKHNAKQL